MDALLETTEARVLGALIEKQLTTPEYYPLSINALANACNQKSNREPVVSYDQSEVLNTVEALRAKNLAVMVTGAGSRTAKYKHSFARRFQFSDAEVAALCVLMLRGPQTVGEIRGRSGRLYAFGALEEVVSTLDGLMARGEGAYVMQLPRQPGRKEARFAHLFCGEPDLTEIADFGDAGRQSRGDQIASLEARVDTLESELSELQKEFIEFRRQFD